MVLVETDSAFQPDLGRLEAALTPRTKAIILNSPNNPTGAVYSAAFLSELGALLSRTGHPATVIADDTYRALAFDGLELPEVPALVPSTVVAFSWSKALAIPGERIGYLALSPRLPDVSRLHDACIFANRTLGFINAPAIWQLVMMEVAELRVDPSPYQAKRDLLWQGLTAMGYEVAKPQGAFYMFPRSPLPDDVAFVRRLMADGILAVPGSGFGRPGYIRLSLTIPLEQMERSLPGFARALDQPKP
jgi:aspartate aminotransferase